MGCSMKARKTNQQGASLVEMALILPLLVLILAGVADLGRAFHDYIVIHNASREGARYASHFPPINTANIDTTKQVAANEAVNSGVTIPVNQVEVVPTYASNTLAQGNPVTVTVRYGFRPIFTRIIGLNVITMTARTQMVVFGYD